MITKVRSIVFMFIGLILLTFAPFSKIYAVTPPDLGLGAADSYAVFGKAGVTNDAGGTTHIWGNVGADLFTSITNLIDSQVGGAIIAPAVDVQTDASSTYDSLMSATQGTPTPLDLAGTHTITPGVYDIAASTLNGALTLDGAGVYIFRSSSSETTVASGTMNLIDGACASNVFWAIPVSMTIGAGAHVEGTIIAQTGLISLGTDATLVGRAISLTQQVTLLLNQITNPTCVVAVAASSAPAAETSSNSSSSTSDICVADAITTVPTILELKRVSPTSIFLSWGPYAGLDAFNIQYGPTNGNWLYNTNVTGFSTTINDLPANQTFWFQVAAKNNCAIGTYGAARPVGQSTSVNPNVLGASIGLPNTGMGPKKDIPWNLVLPGSAFVVLLTSYLIQRKSKSLSKQ